MADVNSERKQKPNRTELATDTRQIIAPAAFGILLQLLFALTRVDLSSFIIAILISLVILISRGKFLKKPNDRRLRAFLLGIVVTESVLILITHLAI